MNVESRKEMYFLGRLFARLTIETGLPYFRGFILEKKMLLCVILFPLRCRFYKGRLWRLKHILPRNIAPSRKHFCWKDIVPRKNFSSMITSLRNVYLRLWIMFIVYPILMFILDYR